MSEFVVHGPFKVPFSRPPAGGKTVTTDRLNEFWNQMQVGVPERPGCYIFGIRASRGMTPVYVGETANNMRAECFTPRNLNIYNQALGEYRKGTPIMFLLVRSSQRGQIDKKEIHDLQNYLIDIAFNKNPNLYNRQGKRTPKWNIRGMIRGGQGRPSEDVKSFKIMMGMA
ncbi:MAG: hypothetical protein HYU29_02090 [Chloroflexi bacterium]|nr:hypothetical protein [Chloroflexota bacterium]MBI2850248.1 hypothetical protein [Chloroflexota bacterium]